MQRTPATIADLKPNNFLWLGVDTACNGEGGYYGPVKIVSVTTEIKCFLLKDGVGICSPSRGYFTVPNNPKWFSLITQAELKKFKRETQRWVEEQRKLLAEYESHL